MISKKDACSWRNWRSMLEYLESLGLEVKEVWVTKKTHRRIRVTSRATNREAVLTAPSGHAREDARAERNWKSQAARIARNLSKKKTGQLTVNTLSRAAQPASPSS